MRARSPIRSLFLFEQRKRNRDTILHFSIRSRGEEEEGPSPQSLFCFLRKERKWGLLPISLSSFRIGVESGALFSIAFFSLEKIRKYLPRLFPTFERRKKRGPLPYLFPPLFKREEKEKGNFSPSLFLL